MVRFPAQPTRSADHNAPTVNVTAPGSGAIVRGTVTLAANATDDVAVTKVELYVDGALVGTDASAPYAYAWNSAGAREGAHAITAKAYDSYPNVTTSTAVTRPVASTDAAGVIDPGHERDALGTAGLVADDPSTRRALELRAPEDGAVLGVEGVGVAIHVREDEAAGGGRHGGEHRRRVR